MSFEVLEPGWESWRLNRVILTSNPALNIMTHVRTRKRVRLQLAIPTRKYDTLRHWLQDQKGQRGLMRLLRTSNLKR